jgi:hypothetical protein
MTRRDPPAVISTSANKLQPCYRITLNVLTQRKTY